MHPIAPTRTALRSTFVLSACAAVCTAAARTQSVVSPLPYTRAEAADANVLPLGWTSVPSRLVQIHEGLPAGTIRGMAFRLDANQANDIPAFQAVIDIQMSSASTTAAAPNSTFDSNHGTDRATVLPSTVVNFVAAPRSLAPRPFLHTISFPSPFVRSGTGPLCWDMRVTNRSSSLNFEYDTAATAANPVPTIITFGTGCRLFGATTAMSVAASSSITWSGRSVLFRFTGARLPASSTVLLSTGGSNTNFSGLPLPFELPGSATAPSGPCTLTNDSFVQLPVFTTASGTLAANTSITFGIHPSMNGGNLFTQIIAVAPQANPLGIATSNGIQMHLSAPFTNNVVSRVWVAGNLVATGQINLGYGAVTRFDY